MQGGKRFTSSCRDGPLSERNISETVLSAEWEAELCCLKLMTVLCGSALRCVNVYDTSLV